MKRFLKKIGNWFKKLWATIAKILSAILIIAAIVVVILVSCFGFPLVLLLPALLAATAAFIIDADTASKIVGKVGDAVAGVAESAAKATGNVVGGLGRGLLDTPVGRIVLFGGLGLVAYSVFSD